MKTFSVEEIAAVLKKNVNTNKLIDVGSGAEELFGVSKPRFRMALDNLKKEGYQVFMRVSTQVGTGKKVAVKILAAPKVAYRDVFDYKIHSTDKDIK